MASDIKTRKIVIISLHPKYVDAIFSGFKTVEFRKMNMPPDIEKMVLYKTSPFQEICGCIDIQECVTDKPSKLWDKYGHAGCISFENFMRYYEKSLLGRCYIINKVYRFKRPVHRRDCLSFSRPPQSFTYLLKSEWEKWRTGMLLAYR